MSGKQDIMDSFAISEIDVKLQQNVSSSTPSYPAKSWLGLVTTIEPLKVCLDDDSSIEDDDEDMFDDDAFTFDDNDFQAIMSHEAVKRISLNSISVISRTSLSSVESISQHQTSSSSPLLPPSHPSAPLLSKATDISTDSSPAASMVSSPSSGRDAPHFVHRLNFQTPSVPCDIPN